MCLYQMFETLFACCDQEKKRMDVENESQRQQEENCEQVNSEKPPAKKKRLGKKTSSVWDHFTVLVGSQPERAACNYCGQNYASSTKTCGTKSMWVHLDKCKKYPFANKEANQMSITAFTKKSGTGDSEETVSKLSQKEIRAEITRYFIVDELPFRHVDGRGFRRFVKKAYPHFVFPSRVTIARDIYQLYLDTRKKLKNDYMCLTAHWIDNNWKLQKMILSFVQVPSHKGDMVGKELIVCLNNWGITKVFAITVDNASSNSVALVKVKEYLQEKRHGIVLNGEMFHMRCCAHIVNLIVCDGLKEMGDSIASICNAVRWNSTYMMLEAALKFKKAFKNLEADANYTKYFDEEKVNGLIIDGPPQNLDWDQAEIFVKFLKTFYELTLKFSGSLYVTSNLFFHEILDIQGELRQLANEPGTLLGKMAASMQAKYDKYWGKIEKMNMLMFVATVLDPRFKLEYLRHGFNFIYEPGTASKMLEKVEKAMRSLYDFYKEMNYPLSKDVSMQGPNETESFPAMSSTSLGPKMFSSWIRDQLQVDGDAQNSDLDDYLNDRRERLTVTDKFDILAWWKLNSQKYKIVSQIAKDVLAVQLSTVASESTFSTSGRILDSFRSSLTPKMVEALICSKNWLISEDDEEPISITQYMDEVQAFQESEEVASGSLYIFIMSKYVLYLSISLIKLIIYYFR
ncbi:hypothetical protein UlMin_036566 [Ulmus minor]